MPNSRIFLILIWALGATACHNEKVRPVVDTVGFAQYDWQMDSLVNRLGSGVNISNQDPWKAVIAPHDDYTYAGEVEWAALSGIRAKTVILFGVAHKARLFNLENRMVLGFFTHWQAPYGKVRISSLQQEITSELPEDLWMIHDSLQGIEHSLEALVPYLQYQDRDLEIIPILVPFMSFEKMTEISSALSGVLADLMTERKLVFGRDLAIAISNDGVHYGDEEWGGKNMAPFGTDSIGTQQARQLDREIIDQCLSGEVTAEKAARFVHYTVAEDDYHEYKWTWCGRYAVPLGLLTAGNLNAKLYSQPLNGQLLGYATSIDHPTCPVKDLGMGTTAPATSRHWVSYVAMGYR